MLDRVNIKAPSHDYVYRLKVVNGRNKILGLRTKFESLHIPGLFTRSSRCGVAQGPRVKPALAKHVVITLVPLRVPTTRRPRLYSVRIPCVKKLRLVINVC